MSAIGICKSPSDTASLAALRDRIQRLERPVRHGALSFGVAALDEALPGGGLALGALHEIVGAGGDEEDGAAAAGFIAGILARLASGPILWCLKRPDLYGPGLQAHGLDPARLVLVEARRDEDILWVVEEALRTPGLAAVVGEIGRLPMVAGRRLQLAAERSGVTALLLRRWRNAADAAAERTRPTAAVTRWRIAALPSAPPELFPTPSPQIIPFPSDVIPGRRMAADPEASPGLGARPLVSGSAAPRHPGMTMVAAGEGRARSGIGKPRWRVELLRCRGGMPGIWDVEVADATGLVSLSAGLADRPAAPGEQKPLRHHAEPGQQRRAG